MLKVWMDRADCHNLLAHQVSKVFSMMKCDWWFFFLLLHACHGAFADMETKCCNSILATCFRIFFDRLFAITQFRRRSVSSVKVFRVTDSLTWNGKSGQDKCSTLVYFMHSCTKLHRVNSGLSALRSGFVSLLYQCSITIHVQSSRSWNLKPSLFRK